MPVPPDPGAPLSDWAAAIRADVRTNSGLAVESAKSVAGAAPSLFAFSGLHGITTWPETDIAVLLEWTSEPLRDRHGEVVRDRDPDEMRRRRWKAKHIVASAIRLGAPVPLLDSEMARFINPPPRPKRAKTDPEEIAAMAARWRPQRWRHRSPRNLETVLPEVRARVLEAEPADVDEARTWLRILAGFALWAVDDRHSDPVTMHTPNNTETWVMRVNADHDANWKNRARGVLRRFGPIINPAAWPRPPQPLPARSVAAPYDAKTEVQFRRAALLPRRDRRARLWVAIAAPGAGLSGPEMADAEYGDLTQRPDGRWEIRVRGDKARRVPVRSDYEPLIHELVALEDRSQFVASDKPGAASQIAQRIRVGDQSLSLTASRNTFVAAHIAAGTPPAALSRITGSVTHDTITQLIRHVAADLSDTDAVEQALGA